MVQNVEVAQLNHSPDGLEYAIGTSSKKDFKCNWWICCNYDFYHRTVVCGRCLESLDNS